MAMSAANNKSRSATRNRGATSLVKSGKYDKTKAIQS